MWGEGRWWNIRDAKYARDFMVGESNAGKGLPKVASELDVLGESGCAEVLFSNMLAKAIREWYEFKCNGANDGSPLILYDAHRGCSAS